MCLEKTLLICSILYQRCVSWSWSGASDSRYFSKNDRDEDSQLGSARARLGDTSKSYPQGSCAFRSKFCLFSCIPAHQNMSDSCHTSKENMPLKEKQNVRTLPLELDYNIMPIGLLESYSAEALIITNWKFLLDQNLVPISSSVLRGRFYPPKSHVNLMLISPQKNR